MLIKINRGSSVPIYIQIAEHIRDMILKGEIPQGYKLPPERMLAKELDVNRSTVLNAYGELKAQGLVDSHVGQGTIVNFVEQGNHSKENDVKMIEKIDWKQVYSNNALRNKDSVSIDILKLVNRNDIISFAAGVGNTKLDPISKFNEIQRSILDKYGNEVFKITPSAGITKLREAIVDFMKSRNIDATVNETMVLSGSQQGIDLIAKAFINEGDTVVVEEPSFFCAIQVFKSLGARIISVPMDNEGMRTDVLESVIKRYNSVFIYTIPTFHNPTGITMSLERRKSLLEVAYRHHIPILEDDPYYELRYDGEAIPPIKAFDSYGYVIYLSSFSKIMFQGLRVGWMIADSALIKQITLMKQMADLHSSSLPQWVLAEFYERGLIRDHVEVLRKDYGFRKDFILERMKKEFPKEIEWINPCGGLFVWCKLPKTINMQVLLLKATSKSVAFLPGETCYVEKIDENYMRLNFTSMTTKNIEEGIKRLSSAITETIEETKKISIGAEVEIKPVI